MRENAKAGRKVENAKPSHVTQDRDRHVKAHPGGRGRARDQADERQGDRLHGEIIGRMGKMCEGRLVALTVATWNRIGSWMEGMEALRAAA
jgi:hypothetical protein